MTNINSKKALFFLIISITTLFLGLIVPMSKGSVNPYYSGEAISFNSKIYIGTVNTSALELFTLENNKLIKRLTINSIDKESENFEDLEFIEDGARLYLYLVNGRYIYSYDITNVEEPILIGKEKDNNWDWFYGLSKYDDKIITLGSKSVKIWNKDLQVVEGLDRIENDYHYNISIGDDGAIYNIKDDELIITKFKEEKARISLNLTEYHNRKPFIDWINRAIYVADDSSLKQISEQGQVIRSFKHISNLGYDTDGTANKNHFYFSDGIGIVKINKEDLSPLDWVYTRDIATSKGWTMGLNVVEDGIGEKIISFSADSIIVLNEDLDLIDYYVAQADKTFVKEELFLTVDKNRAAPNSMISLSGGGFDFNEELKIVFGTEIKNIQSDQDGRFRSIIAVPSSLPTVTDIKVVGLVSGRSYSIGFTIE